MPATQQLTKQFVAAMDNLRLVQEKRRSTVELNENQQMLLKEICRRGGATLQELTDTFSPISSVLISRDLRVMQDAGLVRMVRRSEYTPTRWECTTEGLLAKGALKE